MSTGWGRAAHAGTCLPEARPTGGTGGRVLASVAALGIPALGGGAAALAWLHAQAVDWRVWDLADAMVVTAGVAGALAAAWFTLGLLASLVAVARGVQAPRWTGRLARATAAGLVLTVVGTQASAASSEDIPSLGWLAVTSEAETPEVSAPSPSPTPSPSSSSTAGAPTPTADATPPPKAPTQPTPPTATPSDPSHRAPAVTPARMPRATHVVSAGESLWSISAALLGPTTTDAEVAAAWPALYAANRDVVGADPGLIHPGVTLTVPASLTEARA